LATVVGRRFAMDRSANWEWIKKAYDLLTTGTGGEKYKSASDFITANYAKNIFDEEMEGGLLDSDETPTRIKDNDAVIFYNFREDSAREITHAFVDENFDKFARTKLQNLFFATMTEYEKGLPVHVAFPSAEIEWPLARVIAEAGKTQMHIAETQKYAHITYFLNGGKEEEFKGEDRVLIPSPKVSSYDLEPEMSARQITEKVLESMGQYDFIAVNFANADMVGHTGNFEATGKAFATIDECVGRILPRVLDMNGLVLITADHGNAEEKLYKLTGQEKSQHSINPVPCHLIANQFKYKEPISDEAVHKKYKEVSGIITDIAPTLIELMNLHKPDTMTGRSLLKELLK
jgi:2,3-bisphosphoglycerate-independent phosphoglycerate mutase